MSPKRKSLRDAVQVTLTYWYTLTAYIFYKTKYINCSTFPQDTHAKVQIYSLSLIFSLWSKPHYRSKSFQQDMLDNLRNVAIPGTGIPLSIFALNYWLCLFFIYFLNPLVCFFGAVNKLRFRLQDGETKEKFTLIEQMEIVCSDYIEHLIHPTDWFTFWRLNCRLASLHSLITQSPDYQMEDKWTFLLEGEKCGAAVSPFLTNLETLVCKNKNIEGGMGIYFFTNAAKGGDWIIQEKMENADWLNRLLPTNPPLSTMRILTCSTWYLETQRGNVENEETERQNVNENCHKYVTALSSVLRLGRANASTDHSSVLFDVDLQTGVIQGGMSNAQWYQLGAQKILTCPWLPPDVEAQCRHSNSTNSDGIGSDNSNSKRSSSESTSTPSVSSGHAMSHPDLPNVIITGQMVPDMDKAVDIVIKTHFQMMPDVPMVGWDVTFTPKGVYLLEVNLSCNFFRGSFDIPKYLSIVDQYWLMLEKQERENKNNY